MRTTEKDILMICKGRYNHNKYNSLEEALTAYYREHYTFSNEEVPMLNYKFMLQLWFNDCVDMFLQHDTIRNFCSYVIRDKHYKEKGFLNENGCTEFYEVLFHRISSWLCLINVRDKDGNWIIDLSDYEGIDYII